MTHDLDPERPTPELLLSAYAQGIFPMADEETGLLGWYSPDPRAVFPLDGLRVSRTLARCLRQERFAVSSDTDFEVVMRACGPGRPGSEPTWIDERLIEAYVALHGRGHAHSVEARLDGALVGGLYGVSIGGAFFGESMFTRPDLGGRDASKVCLVHLVCHLRERGFTLLDTQYTTDHLERLGCVEIDRTEYLDRLAGAIARSVTWGEFRPHYSGSDPV